MLLWSSWLEKHPEDDQSSAEDQEKVTAPWDNPDEKAEWDTHASETYYYYWEQYSYWVAQGWTADTTQPVCNGTSDAEAAVIETHQVDEKDPDPEPENHQREEVRTLQDDVAVLDHLLEQNCRIEANGSSMSDNLSVELGGSDDPADGGNGRKRPGASPQQNTTGSSGEVCFVSIVCLCREISVSSQQCYLRGWLKANF